MNHNDSPNTVELSRRNFLKRSSMASLLGLAGAVEIVPRLAPQPVRASDKPPVNCGLIGFGQRGRELASTLGRVPDANLMAICDTYNVMLRRAQRQVPQASRHTDYREVLDNPDVQAVFIATPTHKHRDIAIAALDAGKHVFC